MKTCDLCTKECAVLQALREDYRTEEVKEVCGDCAHDINKVLNKTQSTAFKIISSIVRRFITTKRGKA